MNKEMRIWKITYSCVTLDRVGRQLPIRDMPRLNLEMINTGACGLFDGHVACGRVSESESDCAA